VPWSLCHQSGWGIVFSGDRQAANFTLVAVAPKSDVKRLFAIEQFERMAKSLKEKFYCTV
jgi:hypothetical protein